MVEQFRDGDTKTELNGNKYVWTVSKSVRKTFDMIDIGEALSDEGIDIRQFMKETETMTLRKTTKEA